MFCPETMFSRVIDHECERDKHCIASCRCHIKIALMRRLDSPPRCIISTFGLISTPVDNPIFSPNGERICVAFKLLPDIRTPDRRISIRASKSTLYLRSITSGRLETLILGDNALSRNKFRTKVSTITSTLEVYLLNQSLGVRTVLIEFEFPNIEICRAGERLGRNYLKSDAESDIIPTDDWIANMNRYEAKRWKRMHHEGRFH